MKIVRLLVSGLMASLIRSRRVTFQNFHHRPVLAAVTPNQGFDFEFIEGGDIIEPDGQMTFEVDAPWSGSIKVTMAGFSIVGDESQAEFTFPEDNSHDNFDVSYVDGYTLPIVCGCPDVDGWVNGCNVALKKKFGGCPPGTDNGQGACRNPHRGDADWTHCDEFFEACEHAAYTYETDHGAQNYGLCSGVDITCCVGSKCSRSRRQDAQDDGGDDED